MSRPPNIVVIMTDQQRADLSEREGFALDTTPFLDDLAAQGTWFDHAWTTTPACTPARVSLLTGRYPSATRVRTNHNAEDAAYGADLLDVLAERGYRTAMIGKNGSHRGDDAFDVCYHAGHLSAEDDEDDPDTAAFRAFLRETHFHLARDATPLPPEVQFPHRMVSRAVAWIDEGAGEPFFLWLSFPEPHNPYQVPEPYHSMFPPDALPDPVAGAEALDGKGFKYRWCRDAFERAFPDFARDLPRARANYLGMLRLLDDQIRRFVDALEARGLRDDTLLVFLSDHGDFVGEYGLMRKGPDLAEALVRIPLSFTGAGVRADASPHGAHVSLADVMPTLCEAAGAPLPAGVQGRSLWPLLTGRPYPEEEFATCYGEAGFGGLPYGPDEALDPADDGLVDSPDGEAWGAYDCLNSWTQSGQARAVRRGDWKLVWTSRGEGELYDLARDPAELRNLIDDGAHAEVRERLKADLMTWLLRVQDPLPLPRRRYVMKTHPRNYWDPAGRT